MNAIADEQGTLYIGCPVWAVEHWRGSLYTSNASRASWLSQYSAVFNTVEGNSTFYALPSLETARRWSESVQAGFQFALKVPRAISHDRRLDGAQRELADFIAVAEVLHQAGCLGPSFLQLPPDFGPMEQSSLASFLESLPNHLPWSVEVRHAGWFDQAKNELWLDSMLRELKMDKVLFDSRPLYSKPPDDEIEKVSQKRKPKTPIRTTVTARHPFLRIVGRNRIEDTQPWIDEWAPIIADWLRRGLSPFVFTHAPDDKYAPAFARRMHDAISANLPTLPPLPPWLGETEQATKLKQLDLF
jgi:uncharacterized protein YecE (DUF72 family)